MSTGTTGIKKHTFCIQEFVFLAALEELKCGNGHREINVVYIE